VRALSRSSIAVAKSYRCGCRLPNACLCGIRLQACDRCDAATSNLIVGIVESPNGRMGCWMAASRTALNEVRESELNRR
jgi:hypothetical protein